MARVLLVDDNPVTRALSRKTLLLAGHLVVDATSGADAITMLGSAPIDVVVLEMGLPDMDGMDAIDRIREIPAHAGTPIIGLDAAQGRPPTALAALAGTPTILLSDPCTPHELTEAIQKAVAARAITPTEERTIRLPDEHPAPQRDG